MILPASLIDARARTCVYCVCVYTLCVCVARARVCAAEEAGRGWGVGRARTAMGGRMGGEGTARVMACEREGEGEDAGQGRGRVRSRSGGSAAGEGHWGDVRRRRVPRPRPRWDCVGPRKRGRGEKTRGEAGKRRFGRAFWGLLGSGWGHARAQACPGGPRARFDDLAARLVCGVGVSRASPEKRVCRCVASRCVSISACGRVGCEGVERGAEWVCAGSVGRDGGEVDRCT